MEAIIATALACSWRSAISRTEAAPERLSASASAGRGDGIGAAASCSADGVNAASCLGGDTGAGLAATEAGGEAPKRSANENDRPGETVSDAATADGVSTATELFEAVSILPEGTRKRSAKE